MGWALIVISRPCNMHPFSVQSTSALFHGNEWYIFQETQHHVFLVMEYCNGGDLADYLSGLLVTISLDELNINQYLFGIQLKEL